MTIIKQNGDPAPWSDQKRDRVKKKIDRECKEAAKRLDASSVLIIAFFEDGQFMHMLDGGSTPIPPAELYKRLASAHQVNAESPSQDIAVQ